MSERDNILARIREALAVPAPVPGHDHGPARPTPALPTAAGPAPRAAGGRPVVRRTMALFRKNAADLRADFRLVKDLARWRLS